MDITMAIVCSNDRLLEKCLNSIPESIPIVVVLNYPDDYVLNVAQNDNRVKIIRYDERNLGKLRQLATDNCNTPAICFIDSDCVLAPNAVPVIEHELDEAVVVNIPIKYAYDNRLSKVVSDCRKFTTPEKMLLMPLAFRLDVQSTIGPFFNANLKWGEDSDQRSRLKIAGIPYIVSKSFITHKSLSAREDSKSAIRLGRGTFIQEINGLSRPRKFIRDLSILHEIKSAYKCKMVVGTGAALYHFFVWRPSYKYGYWKTKLKGVD